MVALGEPVLSASQVASFECGDESGNEGMLTGFHFLNRDIISFRLILRLDGGHVAACLDTLVTCCSMSIENQVLALLGRDMIVLGWSNYLIYNLCVASVFSRKY